MMSLTRGYSSDQFTAGGRHLRRRLTILTIFYGSMNLVIVKLMCPDTSYKPRVQKFLDDFAKHCVMDNGFRESLVVTLAHTYMSKCSGIANRLYSFKVLIVLMALSAGGNKFAFELVSANLCGTSSQHMRRLRCKV